MLTPAHPHPDDPLLKEKKEQQRRDWADKRQRPAAWGFPVAGGSAVAGEPVSSTRGQG